MSLAAGWAGARLTVWTYTRSYNRFDDESQAEATDVRPVAYEPEHLPAPADVAVAEREAPPSWMPYRDMTGEQAEQKAARVRGQQRGVSDLTVEPRPGGGYIMYWPNGDTRDQVPEDTFVFWHVHHGNEVWHESTQWRIGKKAAGRLLDGRTWDEHPEMVHA